MAAVSCNLVMEKLDGTGVTIMSQKSPTSELGICRKNGDICMQVTVFNKVVKLGLNVI